MKCLCHKRQPCPVHEDKPLKIVEVVEHHLFVVKIYHVSSTDKWHHTIAKDAMLEFESGPCNTKAEAIASVRLDCKTK